jgi:hypothetical protein
MKKIIALSVALMVCAAFAFGQHKSLEKWPELNTFHGVMSQTFHPAEKGDLKPIRARAGEMLEKAQALQKSKRPAEFQNEQVNTAMDQLVQRVTTLKSLVDKNSDDAIVLKMLTGAHQSFHDIMGEKEEHHEQHDHSDPNHKH